MSRLVFLALFATLAAASTVYDVYTMSNAGPNEVLHYEADSDAQMTLQGRYNTGGAGASFAVADPIGGARNMRITPDGRYLVTVNTASNNVVLFARNSEGGLRRLGTFDTGVRGGWVNALDASNDHVYALVGSPNPNSPSYVVTFALAQGYLELVDTFVLPNSNDFAVGTPIEVSIPTQVNIHPSGFLIISAKRVEGLNQGAVYLVPLTGYVPGTTITVPIDGEGALPFGFDVFQNQIYLTDPGTGSLRIIDVEAGTQSSQSSGGAASCWVGRVGRYLYVSNTGSSTLSSFQLSDDGSEAFLISDNAADPSLPGDIEGIDNVLFVLSPATSTLYSYTVGVGGALTAADQAADHLRPASLNNGPIGLVLRAREEVASPEGYFSGFEFSQGFTGEASGDASAYVEARFQVSQLLVNWASLIDERNFGASYDEIFCEDGEIRALNQIIYGRDAIVGAVTAEERPVGQRHMLNAPAFVSQTTYRITTKSNFVVSGGVFGDSPISHTGAYFDTFLHRADGTWCLDHRFIHVDDVATAIAGL